MGPITKINIILLQIKQNKVTFYFKALHFNYICRYLNIKLLHALIVVISVCFGLWLVASNYAYFTVISIVTTYGV